MAAGDEEPTPDPAALPPATVDAAGARDRRGGVLGRSIKRIVGFLLFALVVQYLVLPQLAVAGREFDGVADRISPVLLALGALLQVAAYVAQAQLTRAVLPEEHRPGLWDMTRIGVASRAISHVVPGGTAAGTALTFRLLRQRGVPGTDAVFAAATQGIGAAVVLNVMLWLALVVSIPVRGMNPYYGTVAVLGVVLLGGFAAMVLLLVKRGDEASVVVGRVISKLPLVKPGPVERFVCRVAERLKELAADPPLLRRAILWAAVLWALDAGSLWVFIAAFDHYVAVDALFVAFGIANVLAAIPITPRGLGLVELALHTSLVGFGVTARVATLSIASYRLVNFWLPIPIGALAYLSLRIRTDRGAERARKALSRWVHDAARQSESVPEWAARHGLRGENGNGNGKPPEGA
jgi:putative heme transporter